ncbi:MAG: HDOD domain-containing protein [Planctomycetes bacterium]|nr:HDOD domain-containing protein [Planctomycetota bacterium]
MKDLKRLIGRIDQLPTLPTVATQILSIVDDPKSGARELVYVISRDPSFTGNLLKRVNSAFFALPRKISDIGQAVALLGSNFVKTTALGVAIFDIFGKSSRPGEPPREDFWRHSFAVGTLARQIGQKQPDVNAETAFAAGLLHDIGHLVLECFDPVDLKLAYAIADADEVPLPEAERRAMGTTHAEIGAELLTLWHFPSELIEPIRFHHRPEECGQHPQLARIVAIANYQCNRYGFTRGVKRSEPALPESTWASLAVPRPEIEDLTQAMAITEQEEDKVGGKFA